MKLFKHAYLKLGDVPQLCMVRYPIASHKLVGDAAVLANALRTGTPVGILLDRLTEYPEEVEGASPQEVAELVAGMRVRYKNKFYPHTHQWEDVAYHGSPIYACKYCNIYKNDNNVDMFCKSADRISAQEEDQKQLEEVSEYNRMKADRERWEYLNTKYGQS